MQSVWVWSLIHDITTTLRLRPTPNFLEIHSNLHKHNSIRGPLICPLHSIIRC